MSKLFKKVMMVGLGIGAMMMLTGCDGSIEYANDQNEMSIKKLIEQDELPKIERSLERENIKRRIEFINQPDRVGYLYLLTTNGQLIKEVQVSGKVSSLNSYLTPMEEYYASGAVLSTADVDGTWGENDSGIFWFTPDGVYQEWTGQYLYSSERMSFESKPILMEAKDDVQ